MKKVRTLALDKKILAANTVAKGGLFMTVVKMAVGNMIGAELSEVTEKEIRNRNYGALLLEIDGNENIEELFRGTSYKVVGKTTDKKEIVINTQGSNQAGNFKMSIEEIISKWTKPLEQIFPTVSKAALKETAKEPVAISYTARETARPAVKIGKPRVFIPAFPGTNCEVDSKRAFEKAGAIADIQILRNLTPEGLNESIREMAENIRKSQIIMIPGGFSGGDEPDGSAKFITAVFRNAIIQEAVEDLLQNRDGLMLGVCNGFQALIKLGLVPYGKITKTREEDPTLTYNRIGRHVSCLVRTRIASVKSPWFSNVQVGDMHTIPVSHGEGRFIANEEVLEKLIKNGQVATQYVNLDGIPSFDEKYNPNGSALAIEGITSPDGRILGKMGHSERIGINLYKNVLGDTDQKIFEAGVSYFR